MDLEGASADCHRIEDGSLSVNEDFIEIIRDRFVKRMRFPLLQDCGGVIENVYIAGKPIAEFVRESSR